MSDEHHIKFAKLHPDGTVTGEREIRQTDVQACPHFILVPEHYREDGSCRCDDPEHAAMRELGYKWRDGRWQA